MNILNAHPYTLSIFLSTLVAWENDKYISEQIKMHMEGAELCDIIRDSNSTLLLIEHCGKRIIVHNGTQNAFDWGNNIRAYTNRYFHDGISDEYFDTVSKYVIGFARKAKLGVLNCGHSQGESESELATLDIRERLGINVESIGFCGPDLCTMHGLRRMRDANCCITHLIMHGDIVSRVGGVTFKKKFPFVEWAKNYGYVKQLPKTQNDIVMGHAWSHVMDSLKKEYLNWGMREQLGYIDTVRHVCKK